MTYRAKLNGERYAREAAQRAYEAARRVREWRDKQRRRRDWLLTGLVAVFVLVGWGLVSWYSESGWWAK